MLIRFTSCVSNKKDNWAFISCFCFSNVVRSRSASSLKVITTDLSRRELSQGGRSMPKVKADFLPDQHSAPNNHFEESRTVTLFSSIAVLQHVSVFVIRLPILMPQHCIKVSVPQTCTCTKTANPVACGDLMGVSDDVLT